MGLKLHCHGPHTRPNGAVRALGVSFRERIRERGQSFLPGHRVDRLVEQYGRHCPPDRVVNGGADRSDGRFDFRGQRRHGARSCRSQRGPGGDDGCRPFFCRGFFDGCRAGEPGAPSPWRRKRSAPFHDAAAEAAERRLAAFCGLWRGRTAAPARGASAAFSRAVRAVPIAPHQRFMASIFSASRSRLS